MLLPKVKHYANINISSKTLKKIKTVDYTYQITKTIIEKIKGKNKMQNKEIKVIANNITVDSIMVRMPDAQWIEKCKKQYSFESLAIQYGEAIDQFDKLYMKLNAANTANAGIQLMNKELTEKISKLDKEAQDLYNKNLELQGELAICKKRKIQLETALLKIKAIWDEVFEDCEGCGDTLCIDCYDPDRCNDAKTLDIINEVMKEGKNE